MDQQIYQVVYKVRPTPEHPKFYDWQFGWLVIWIFAKGPEHAEEKASKIFDQLPYEIVVTADFGQRIAVHKALTPPLGCEAQFEAAKNVALSAGIGFCLLTVPTGSDEGWFELQNPP